MGMINILYPINVNCNVSPADAIIVNLPSVLVLTPLVVPLMVTETHGSGNWSLASVTVPVIFLLWANTLPKVMQVKTKIISNLFFMF
jgi:hypothetical protein